MITHTFVGLLPAFAGVAVILSATASHPMVTQVWFQVEGETSLCPHFELVPDPLLQMTVSSPPHCEPLASYYGP